MFEQPLSVERRAELLRRFLQAQEEVSRAGESKNARALAAARALREQIRTIYLDELPRITMSCCPFDGKPLVRTFDPFGLDGLWWQPDARPLELPACTHFCVLRGAVHYQGLPARAGDFEVDTGPEVPYVIPRLLEQEGMVGVVSKVRMHTEYLVYLVTYFAKRRPPVAELTADWPRRIFTYKDAFGESGSVIPNDLWSFDLLPWLRDGRLLWCRPGTDNSEIATGTPGEFPYLNIEGRRTRLSVQKSLIYERGLPDGMLILPLDL
jgi:hypothetical protein